MFAKTQAAGTIAGSIRIALLAIAVALTAVSGGARAEQKATPPAEPSPAAMKLAREIIDLKNATSLFTPMVPGVIERVRSMLLQTSPTLRKDLDEVSVSLQKVFAPRTSELLNDIAWLYASRFSEAELKEIGTFYRSATGKRVVAEEPLVFDDAMNGLKGWQEKFAEDVISRFRVEMKKRGHDL